MDVLVKMMVLFCALQGLPTSSWLVAGAHQDVGESDSGVSSCSGLSELLKIHSFGYFRAKISLCCPRINRESHEELLKPGGEYKIIKMLRLEKSCRITESEP